MNREAVSIRNVLHGQHAVQHQTVAAEGPTSLDFGSARTFRAHRIVQEPSEPQLAVVFPVGRRPRRTRDLQITLVDVEFCQRKAAAVGQKMREELVDTHW